MPHINIVCFFVFSFDIIISRWFRSCFLLVIILGIFPLIKYSSRITLSAYLHESSSYGMYYLPFAFPDPLSILLHLIFCF